MSGWGSGSVEPSVVTVAEALPAPQCHRLVRAASSLTWGPAADPTVPGPQIEWADTSGSRDEHGCALLEDPRLALQLYYRVAGRLPATIGNMDLLCVRPKMELLRYRARRHSRRPRASGAVADPLVHHMFTLQLYLNDGFEGGATRCPTLDREGVAQVGHAVIHNHDLEVHEAEVTAGEKVVLRATIYYVAGRMQARLRY